MSLPTLISLALTVIGFAFKAYQFIQGQISEAEYLQARDDVHGDILRLKGARSPKEREDAATDMARTHNSIVN